MIEAGREEYTLAPYLDILEDRNGAWTIEDVTSSGLSARFIPYKKKSAPDFGFTDSAFWVRFKVKNRIPEEKEWLLEIGLPLLDKIELYIPQASGGFAFKKAGRLLPFSEREIMDRNFLFRLPINPGDEQIYYLRFKTESVMILPITLLSKDRFYIKDDNEYIVLGIYYGIILVMFLYNLFIFLSLRDRNYLFYILYIFFYALFQIVMNGVAYEYLWPTLVWWNKHSTMFFAGITILWAAEFTRNFLLTKEYAPKFNKLLIILAVSGGLSTILSITVSYSITVRIVTALGGILALTFMSTGIMGWQKGYRSAKYFTIAWSFFLTGIFIGALRNFELLPINFITMNSMQIGSAIEVVLLSLALADRINVLREEKERLYNVLTLKEEYFRSLIENSSDIITVLAADGTILFSSPSIRRILGYEAGEITGRIAFGFIHPEDIPRVLNTFTGLIQKPGSFKKEEFRFRHKDGSWRVFESIGYNLLKNPAIKGIIINSRDITEHREMQEDMVKSGHLASIGELAAGVAHEINNPINGIINYAQMLINRLEKESKESEKSLVLDISERIIREGNRIAGIVRNLLSFAREVKEEKTRVHVGKILTDTLSLSEVQMRRDGIKLRVDIPKELPEIVVNPQQIQQVFLNIINNAQYALNCKYSGEHEYKVLEISGETINIDNYPYVKTTFYDRGVGIPANIINRLIDPFFTTKPRGEGTGLGLSISHGIVKGYGGDLLIDSTEGEFTKVTVILPAGRRE